MFGNKCGGVVFIVTFWAQPIVDKPLRKTDKDSLVTTVSRGLPEWFQIFSWEIVAEFLLLLHPWVAKAVSQLHFLITYVMHSLSSAQVCLNYCHSQTTLSQHAMLVLRHMENRLLSQFHALLSAVLDKVATKYKSSILEGLNLQT